jgi:hypothetical protein
MPLQRAANQLVARGVDSIRTSLKLLFTLLQQLWNVVCVSGHTDKKENQIFFIYKEIQSGAVAKSYMRKGFIIYEECANISPYMRMPLVIYDFATAPF